MEGGITGIGIGNIYEETSGRWTEEMINIRANELGLGEDLVAAEKWEKRKAEGEQYLKKYVEFLNKYRTVSEVVEGFYEMARDTGFVDLEDVESGKSNSRKVIIRRGNNISLGLLGTNDVGKAGLVQTAGHVDFPDYRVRPRTPLLEFPNDTVRISLVQHGGFVPSERAGCNFEARGEYIDKTGKKRKITPVRGTMHLKLPHANHGMTEKPIKQVYSLNQWNLDTGYATKAELISAMGLSSEKDFELLELEVTPTNEAFVQGIRIFGPHQDDLSCSFGAAYGLISAAKELGKSGKEPENTCIWTGSNNEEVGSEGYNGARDDFKKVVITRVVRAQRKMQGLDYEGLSEEAFVREKVIENSDCISADVTNGYDPTHKEFDKRYVAELGKGITFSTSGAEVGLRMTCDTPKEVKFKMKKIFDNEKIPYQEDMLTGNADLDAGGLTVANMYGNIGYKPIEIALPLKSMHSTVEEIDTRDATSFMSGMKASYLAKRS